MGIRRQQDKCAGYNTCVAHMLKFLVAGWGHVGVSVEEISPVDNERIRFVWGQMTGSIYQVDFLENVGFDEDATEGRRQENN